MNKKFFIGIDVSKPYFDATVMAVFDHVKQPVQACRFDNTPEGIKQFGIWLRGHGTTMDSNSLVVMENTGIYHRLIWAFCSSRKLPLHIGNAAHIKWSFGIARGKNDRIDSARLCGYAFREADSLMAKEALDPKLLHLKDFISARTKLLKQATGLRVSARELGGTSGKAHQKLIERSLRSAIEGLARSIRDVEAQIRKIIEGNSAFRQSYRLLVSIPGIGHVTAVYLIGCTANFAGGPTGKQLACYAGVAPFEHTSGISIRGRAKVHRMANKELKRLLYMGAMSVIQYDPEFRLYYHRKADEGKNNMSVINAVKNKILLRVAAVIKNQSPYKNNYKPAA